jgi:hypothetical protein
MMIESKHSMKTRIISAYHPCKSTLGLETAYTQHLLYWLKLGVHKDPRHLFMEDLKQERQKWQAEGEQIILCSDFSDFNTGDTAGSWSY